MKDSAPIQFLDHIWQHMQKATGHSWLKINHAMSAGLSLSISSGMEFSLHDFEEIAKRFRSGYWHYAENSYRTAVLYRNASAYLALENKLGRKPFILKGASVSAHTGDGPCGQGLARLIIGATFVWNAERVTVTSFNDKKQSFTACSYQTTDSLYCQVCKSGVVSYGKSSILHRYTLSHADLSAEKKRKKSERAEA